MNNLDLGFFASTVLETFSSVGSGFANLLPSIIAALLVLLIGWALADWLGKLIKKILDLSKIDELIDKANWDKSLREAGIEFNIAKLLGWLTKWFLLVVVLIAVAEILSLSQITQFLRTVALYIPNIIVAVVILLVGLVLGNFAHKVVEKSVHASKIPAASGFLATLTRWAIFIFALLAALSHLKIAASLVNTLFTGLVGMLALAGGLAFGLGGKDAARDFIEKLRREIK